MLKRMKLDANLKELLGPTVRVYHQPPNNLELQIPACIYTFERFDNLYADNAMYMQFERYTVKLIVTSQTEPFVLSLMKNPKFTFGMFYPTGAAQFTYIFHTTI